MEKIFLKLSVTGENFAHTLVVPASWSLAFLHEVFQALTEGKGLFPYAFATGAKKSVRFASRPVGGCRCDDCSSCGEACATPDAVTLETVLTRKGAKLSYEGGFGDGRTLSVVSLGFTDKITGQSFDSPETATEVLRLVRLVETARPQ